MSFGKLEYDPIRDAYLCEICRHWFPGLGYHIKQAHGMDINKYKEMFGLEKKKSLIVKRIAKVKRDNVYRTGMNKNLTMAGWLKNTTGRVTIQKYKRSQETKNKLDTLHTYRRSEKRIRAKQQV